MDDFQIALLDSPITADEIKEAVWSCEGSKAPGPDGYTFTFIKKHWELLKKDIFSYVKEFEQKGRLTRGCNSTFLTLVPKVSDPFTLHDYRPISLVGC